MQLLTNEYVVGGYLPPTDIPLVGFLNMPNQAAVTLNNAKMSALGAQTVISETAAEITLPKATIIAIILRDEAGARSAMMQMPSGSRSAVVYAGPYLIRATFKVIGEGTLGAYFSAGGGNMFAVTDAEVHCQLPGAKFSDLKAPVLILNKLQVQLYHPA